MHALAHLSVVFIVAALSALAPRASADPPTALRNITIIDTAAGRAAPGRAVLIDGPKIATISDNSSFTPPAGATVIDASGLYLLPALFDAHVHYVDPDSFGPLFIASGVLFARDMGNVTETAISNREGLKSGDLIGPEMVVTGAIIDGDPPVWPFSEPCDTPDEARAAVRKLKAAGVDQIKVYSRLKKDVYQAAVAEAKAVGLKPVGHIPSDCTVEDAIAAGQASNEHMMAVEKILQKIAPAADAGEDQSRGLWPSARFWYLYPEVDKTALDRELRTLAASGMMQCPTLVVMQGIASIAGGKADEDPRLAYIPGHLRSFWGGDMYKGFALFAQDAVPFMKSMVGDMHRAGVPLMVGTDLANPYVYPGFSVHEEMKLFVEAGLTPAEALLAATLTPARFLGVDSRLGTAEPGKEASFVLLTADPLADISNTKKINSVFQRGKRYDRAALDGLLKSVRDAVASSAVAKSDIVLDLPGEVILRGTYGIKFGPYDAGTEDVLITKTNDGYAMMAHGKPQGGPQAPYLITWRTGPDLAFRSATYKQLTKVPIEAAYRLEGGKLIATAKQAGKPDVTASADAAPGDSLSSPSYASDFFGLPPFNLKVGETRETGAIAFGFPDWKPARSPLKVTRAEDVDLPRPDGKAVKARLYKQVLTTPMGAFTSDTWTDDRGVVLKTIMVMPFGTMTIELKP